MDRNLSSQSSHHWMVHKDKQLNSNYLTYSNFFINSYHAVKPVRNSLQLSPCNRPHALLRVCHVFSPQMCFIPCDLFLSITYRISMHSTHWVITSHPVSSPWLQLSSLHLFSIRYYLSHLLLVVPIWNLCWVPIFLSPLNDTGTRAHRHTHAHTLTVSMLLSFLAPFSSAITTVSLHLTYLYPNIPLVLNLDFILNCCATPMKMYV